MTIHVWQGGALRNVTAITVKSGGVLRTIRSIRVMSGGSLRTIFTAISSLSATAAPASVSGSGLGLGAQAVMTDSATCTPSGGVAPYTYSWTLVSAVGDLSSASPDDPTFAATAFSASVLDEGTGVATFKCAVTDSLGATAESNLVEATFTNSSGA